ncbi:MAG: hypothetical protein MJZ30_11625 [Paludibacteraceae bacterium]|nr:hypothetical protein [Paludibacteraceae bacterium]
MTEEEISKAVVNLSNELDRTIREKIRPGKVFNFLDLYPLVIIESPDDCSDVYKLAVTHLWSDPDGLLSKNGEPGVYAECHAMTEYGPANDEMRLFLIDNFIVEDKKWILDQINEVIAVYGEDKIYKMH